MWLIIYQYVQNDLVTKFDYSQLFNHSEYNYTITQSTMQFSLKFCARV